MSERAATQEVAAERFVMVVIEQIRDIGAGCDVTSPSTSAFAAWRVNEKLEMSVPHSRVRLPHQNTADKAEDISSEEK